MRERALFVAGAFVALAGCFATFSVSADERLARRAISQAADDGTDEDLDCHPCPDGAWICVRPGSDRIPPFRFGLHRVVRPARIVRRRIPWRASPS